MVKLIFEDMTGREHVVDAQPGQTVMQAALEGLVPGIEATCGGCCVCATCHCYVQDSALACIPEADDVERGTLESVSAPRQNSRLVCQIAVSEALDGARFHVAASPA